MLNVKLNFVGQWDVQGSFAKNIKGSSDNKSSIISNINFSHLWNFSSPLNSKGLMKPVDDKEAKKKKNFNARGDELLVSLFTTCETQSHTRTVFNAEEPKQLPRTELSREEIPGHTTRTMQR